LAGQHPKVIVVIMRKLVAIAQAVLKANKPFDKESIKRLVFYIDIYIALS